jgi:signal transduction histidine kinase
LLAEQGAVLRERQRLARELHDSVTQSLYSLNLLATTGQRALADNDTERISRYFDWMSETSQQALKEMRLLIYELRPPVLAQEGLISALQQRLDAVEGRAGIETRLIVEGDAQVPRLCEEAFYRIAMEALNNALKHAEATAVTIELDLENGIAQLQITDNGRGFGPEAATNSGGMGLAVMQERADEISADLQVISEPGQGTQIRVSVSCSDEA